MTPSNLRDPVGLLARSPELAALAERSADLRRTIEQGRPLDAYRALYWAHRRRRFGELGEVAATLLARRRLFLKPITSAPKMMTYNGVGTSLYGRSDHDPNDGTYVATLFLVFVFVPVFPLASYLVRDGQLKGRRSWSFMAKVPLGTATHLWQRGVAVAVLALLAVGAAHAFEGYEHNTLHVVNGLDHPVSAELSGSPRAMVLPGEETALRTSVGKHTLDVRDGDRVIESATVDVPRGPSAVAWNILGAAPVYLAQEVYTKEGSTPPAREDAIPEVMCGQSLIVKKGVEYVFETPPKSVSMPDSTRSVTKSHLGIGPGGTDACVAFLTGRGDAEKAARLTLTVARATRATATSMGTSLETALAVIPAAEAEAFAKEILARDDGIEANRLYQNVLLLSGQRARAIAEYDARLAAKPGADSEYLAIRVRTIEEERKTIDGVIARFPDHPFLRRVEIYAHYASLELPQVETACEALRRLDPKQWQTSLDPCVDALVGTRRGSDALTLLQGMAADSSKTPGERRAAQLLAYRVAHSLGVTTPDVTSDEDDEGSLPVFARAITGLPIEPTSIGKLKDEHLREALRIVGDARSNPDAALARVRKADPQAAALLPASVHLLLFAEATRRDDAGDVAERLASAPGFQAAAAGPIKAFVRTGAVTDEVAELPLELRAALELARSRIATLSGKERADLIALAKSSDVLLGPVSVAIASWKP